MDYIELVFKLPREKVDLVSTFLVAGGYDTFEICDLSDLVENAGAMFCDYIEDELLEKESAPPSIKFYFDASEENKAKEIRDYLLGVCAQLGYDDVTVEEASGMLQQLADSGFIIPEEFDFVIHVHPSIAFTPL